MPRQQVAPSALHLEAVDEASRLRRKGAGADAATCAGGVAWATGTWVFCAWAQPTRARAALPRQVNTNFERMGCS